MCCLLCMTTDTSHQYLPLSCPTTLPSVQEQSQRPDLSRAMWCLVLQEMEVKFYLLLSLLPVFYYLFVHHLFYCNRKTGCHTLVSFFAIHSAFTFKWCPDFKPPITLLECVGIVALLQKMYIHNYRKFRFVRLCEKQLKFR